MDHAHVSGGSPFVHRKKITCPACIAELDTVAAEWRLRFALRDGHDPETFWVNDKPLWEA